MTLKLLKIQEEFDDGKVLYHHYLNKSPEELEAIVRARTEREQERARRRAEQEENINLNRKKDVFFA